MNKMSRAEEIAARLGYYIDKSGEMHGKFHVMKGAIEGRGYRFVIIRDNGIMYRLRFHRLQAYQKFGDEIYKEGIQVRHLDGNSLNNSFENIAIGTNKDNQQDIPFLKRRSRIAYTKYSDDMAMESLCMSKKGLTQKEIGERFGISASSVQYLIKRAKALKQYYDKQSSINEV